jgi:hypothetical protein
MNRPINEMVDVFFTDLERDSRLANEESLRAWLWFTCDASMRGEVETAIRADERWQNRKQVAKPADIHLTLPPAIYERLRTYAFEARMDRNSVIREALIRFLDAEDRKSKKDRD